MHRYVTSLKKTGKRPARKERLRRDKGAGEVLGFPSEVLGGPSAVYGF